MPEMMLQIWSDFNIKLQSLRPITRHKPATESGMPAPGRAAAEVTESCRQTETV
jgi:hypothetical protein